MTALPWRAVLFDFDFTLADSSVAIVACIRYAFERLGLPPPSVERILPTVGLSLRDTLRALAGPAYDTRFDEFHRAFVERADQVMTASTRLYPAVPELVRALRARGLDLAICTSKFRYRIVETLTRDGLLDAFALIIGSEDVQQHKPHPEALLLALQHLGCPASQALYIGDSAPDAEAAARAGIAFIGVRTGHTLHEGVARFGALAVLPEIGDLLPWLDEHP